MIEDVEVYAVYEADGTLNSLWSSLAAARAFCASHPGWTWGPWEGDADTPEG